jgi:hypothetical protein
LQDSLRWRRGGEATGFEECDGVPAVVALRSSSMVSRGVLQIVEMKGSEMGPKEEGEEGRSLEFTERDGSGSASRGIR